MVLSLTLTTLYPTIPYFDYPSIQTCSFQYHFCLCLFVWLAGGESIKLINMREFHFDFDFN